MCHAAVAGADRLLVFDSIGEFSRTRRVTPVHSIQALGELVIADVRQPGPFRYGYVGPVTREHFDTFCRLAWVWLRSKAGTLVVEELADVTSPAKAPAAWGAIVRKCRHIKGAHVFALTQRPAESDKTIVGNAAVVHAGFFNFPEDADYCARILRVDVGELLELPEFHFIERDMRARMTTRGVTRLSR